MSQPAVTLHTFYRSSSAARVRIALNLKGIPYTPVFVNLLAGEQKSEAYRALNPSGTVPLLVHHCRNDGGGGTEVSMGQSVAALEYLEEAFPQAQAQLLPPPADAASRALVRELVGVAVADMQPVTSLRVLDALQELGGDRASWSRRWIVRGLEACEALLARAAGSSGGDGPFAYGETPTLADACLVPAVWGAMANGVDTDPFPRVKRAFDAASALEPVQMAHWKRQGDCPEDQRSG